MKKAIVTVTTEGYVDMTETFIYSLWNNGEVQDADLIVLHTDKHYQQLENYQKDEIKNFWKGNIIFHAIDFEAYNKVGKWEPQYWALEAFRFSEYDRVLFVDSDMLCVRPIPEVFDFDLGIAMVWEMPRQQYNSGTVLTNKSYRTEDVYQALMNHQKRSETFGRDQAVLNEYFKGKIDKINQKYNCMPCEWGSYNEAGLVHLFYKPNRPESRDRYNDKIYFDVWHEHFNAVKRARGGR